MTHPGMYLWIWPSKRPSVNNENSYALGTRKQEKEGETKNIMENDSGERTLDVMQHTWGSITKLDQDRQGLRKFFLRSYTPWGVTDSDDLYV